MGIKHEAKGIDRCLCFGLKSLSRVVTQKYDHYLMPYSLTSGQMAILLAVDALGAMPLQELKEYVCLDQSTLSRSINPLKRRAYVDVQSESWDRRRCKLMLTVKGRNKMLDAYPAWEKAQEEMIQILENSLFDDLIDLSKQAKKRVRQAADSS